MTAPGAIFPQQGHESAYTAEEIVPVMRGAMSAFVAGGELFEASFLGILNLWISASAWLVFMVRRANALRRGLPFPSEPFGNVSVR